MSRGDLDPLVNQFQHEAHRKRASEALQSLKKIASIVKPIMRQRNWVVGTLCEFYPEEANLLGLNINRGQKICLRLRYPGDANQFLPLEQVVDTMLHELSHIVHGPHNAEFQALWDQLRDEHQALVLKGYTGEGFLGRGDRLGGARIPMHEARRRARVAAEKRRTLGAGSGQKLGGRPILRGEDVRSVIVNAIEQRNRITQGCASGTTQGQQIEQDVESTKPGQTVTKADDDDANEAAIMQAYIEMIQEEERQKHGQNYMPPSQANPAGMRSLRAPPVSPKSLKSQQESIEQAIRSQKIPPAPPADTKPAKAIEQIYKKPTPIPPPANPIPPDTWTCEICTLVNPISYLQCEACEIERPPKYSSPIPQQKPPLQPHRSSHHLPISSTSSIPHGHSFAPRLGAAEAHARFEAEGAHKRDNKPLAWRCDGCGNYVEQEWWTCQLCGRMRGSS